jgi:hypothetical protein
MKAEQRERWLALTRIDLPKPFNGNISLCHMCRYAEWDGYDCRCADLDCSCGLDVIVDNCENVWADSCDCWAFRPYYVYEDCVDAVGLFLQGLWADWSTVRTIKKK